MARKRLTPANPDLVAARPAVTSSGPPIAQVAGETAAAGALQELADDVARARAEGRMVLEIPTNQIAPDHLARDRIDHNAEDMRTLMKSIYDHGQRTPIEVTELDGDYPYGLISGWRRITALQQLRHRTGQAQYDTVLALLRRPKDSADAYVSMVEENEVRVGLSYYERARVAAEATKRGVFETEKKALLTLFASASRPKRSRIRSFIEIYHALDGVLKFPTAIAERAGLALVDALRKDDTMAQVLTVALRDAAPQSAEEEGAVIAKVIAPVIAPPAPKSGSGSDSSNVPRTEHPAYQLENGLTVTFKGKKIEISGKPVSLELFEQLKDDLSRLS